MQLFHNDIDLLTSISDSLITWDLYWNDLESKIWRRCKQRLVSYVSDQM